MQACDLILGSDVVYDASHNTLAHVVSALLAPPPAGGGWRPRAVFLSPNGRPHMRAFVEALPAAGLRCRIESIDPGCAMVRRLRGAHEGWGKDRAFSLYFVSQA